MTLETMQKEGRELLSKVEFLYGVPVSAPEKTMIDLDQHTANTWKAAQEDVIETLKHYGLQAPTTDSLILTRHDLLLLVQNKK